MGLLANGLTERASQSRGGFTEPSALKTIFSALIEFAYDASWRNCHRVGQFCGQFNLAIALNGTTL